MLEADQSRAEQVHLEVNLALQQAREEAALEAQRRRLEREQLDEEEAVLTPGAGNGRAEQGRAYRSSAPPAAGSCR